MNYKSQLKIKRVHYAKLNPAAYNPRKNLEPGDIEYDKLQKSIMEFGEVDPIVWNETTGNIVGGHQRFKVLRDMGQEDFDVSVVNLDIAKEGALNIALNKIAGEWDYLKLKDLIAEIDTGAFDIGITGFDAEELKELFGFDSKDGKTDDDAVPEDVVPICKLGDLYQLRDHRLLCGDSTSKDDVGRLFDGDKADMVFTDPPYGVSYKGNRHDIINGDQFRGKELYNLLFGAFKQLFDFTKSDPAAYIWHASRTQMIFETALNDAGFEVKEQLIWNKGMSLGRSDYHWAHEPCFYVRKREENNQWYGDRKHKTILREDKVDFGKFKKDELVAILNAIKSDSTVWEIKKDSVNTYVHPTQKPVDLCMKALINNTLEEMIVLDLFGGSGSTMIACEKINRKCYMMELDLHYCDVIIKRWEDFTGGKAEKI